MTVVFIVLAVLVILGLVLVLVGRLDSEITTSGRPGVPQLPDLPWTSSDLRNMKFRVGLRGYRMEDVDAMMSLLALQLESQAHPEEIEVGNELRSSDPTGPATNLSRD